MKNILFTIIISLAATAAVIGQVGSNGWTMLDKTNASKIIYVSSTEGNDATGVVYNPTAISSDPFNPTQSIQPFKTIAAAVATLNNREGAWVLLKRGDVFYEPIIPMSGSSVTTPFVYSSYGSGNEVPLLKTGSSHGVGFCCNDFRDFWVIGLSFYAHTRNPNDLDYTGEAGGRGFSLYSSTTMENILLEGNVFRFYSNNVIQGPGVITNITLRRNFFFDNYGGSSQGHSQGMYTHNLKGLVMEDNIFDHNGWYKQSINSDNSKADGQATIFNHNTYFANCNNITFKDNSFHRPSSIGTKWTANDGPGSAANLTLINNLYNDCEVAISLGGNDDVNPYRFKDITISGNVVTSPGMARQTNRTLGWGIDVDDWDGGLVSGNLSIDQTSPSVNNCFGIRLLGYTKDVTVIKNIMYNLESARYLELNSANLSNVTILNNELNAPANRISYLVQADQAVDHLDFLDNAYSNADLLGNVYRIGSNRIDYSNWITQSAETGSSTVPPTYPDPTRTLDRYINEILGLGSRAEFYTKLRTLSHLKWDDNYTAKVINQWLFDGFIDSGPGVSLSPTTLTLVEGGPSKKLTAFIHPTNAPNQNVTWTSSDPAVTISGTGLVANISAVAIPSGPVTITVTTEAGSFQATATVTVSPRVNLIPMIITTSVTSGTLGIPFVQNLTANGGDGTLTWSVVDPAHLPPGLSLSTQGVLSGTPTSAGNYTFIVKVTDSDGDTDTQSLDLTAANPPADLTPIINTTNLPDATLGNPYNIPLSASSGDGTLTWSVVDPANVTPGLSLSPQGVLSGTPTSAGNFTFMVKVTDSDGDTDTQSLDLSITNTVIPVVSIHIDQSNVNLVVGDTFPLTVSINPDNATNKTLTFSSGNISVATIDAATGVIIAVGVGTTIITVTSADEGFTDSITVTIEESGTGDIPKFFSPNQDGQNENWSWRNISQYQQGELFVYSRSGTLVYSCTGYQNDWDGTYKGAVLNGDFYYILKHKSGKIEKGAFRIIVKQ